MMPWTKSLRGSTPLFVDNRGNVLGTFVYVLGAKIKVLASGAIAIDEQDYTYKVKYDNKGRVHSIGDADFSYFNNGQIRSINGIVFTYFNR
jgi:hypothetical protein